jgi:small multidrug resistance pump
MGWLLLGLAIASEVTATLALRASAGMTRPGPVTLVILGYVTAFALLAQVLKDLGVGPAYATWSGLGTVGAALGGWMLFSERLTPMTIGGMVVVVSGVVIMNLGGGVTHG